MSEPDRFAIIPIYSDSTGCGAIPADAVAHGSWSAITGRIRDSKQQRQLLTIINDAEHARGTLQEIRRRELAADRREAELTAREDAVAAAEASMLQDTIRKLDERVAKMDSEEARRIQAAIDALPDPDNPASYR